MEGLTFWFLFAAFGAVWLLLFGYVLNLRARQHQVEVELAALRKVEEALDGD